MQPCTPERVGLSSNRLGRIHPAMQRHVDEGRIAGMVTLVARRGRIAHVDCVGYSRLETRQAMAVDTIVRIYSMSKPITSVAVMLLYEEGRFQLNDPISAFIPEFADVQVYAGETSSGPALLDAERPITIHHLLTHTAGLAYGLTEETQVDTIYRDWRRTWAQTRPDLEAMVRELARLPLVCQPGTCWKYSMATDVLGRLVEIVSGQPFDLFLRERIFEPLGMIDTDFWVPPEKADRLAELYTQSEMGLRPVPPSDVALGHGSRPALLSGGGGLLSTTLDYLRFAQMLLNRGTLNGARILGRKTVEYMVRNHLPSSLLPFALNGTARSGAGFGLGGEVVMDPPAYGVLCSEGRFGWGGMAATQFWVDPEEDLLGLIMPQVFGNASPFRAQFRALVYQALVD